jgi:hypothetical protein
LFESFYLSLFLVFAAIIYFQHIVALIKPNTIVMPTMDQATYATNKNSPVNYCNFSTYDNDRIDIVESRYMEMVKRVPKMRYKVKYICGDPYYEEMSYEEAVSKIVLKPKDDEHVLRSIADCDAWMADNLPTIMPLDGPLTRIYCQKYEPNDQDDLPPEKRAKGISYMKVHHSFCDGVSVMTIPLALSEEFDRSYFLNSKDATWI